MSLFNKKNLDKHNKYGITEDDMIENLKGFPVGVVVRMIEEQENQGNTPDIKVFQKRIRSNVHFGAFDWDYTEAGWDFWNKVITMKKFKQFFKEYPEYEKYN